LGLSDRARVVDLFEHVMKGDIASALNELKSQYDTGAEPYVMLTDLADFIHLVTRLKYVPDTANDSALSEIEKTRGKEFAEKLSVRILGRAWQILLKGVSEVAAAERPLSVAEMVLVRMTHASSLPTPDELVREKGGDSTPRVASMSEAGSAIADAAPASSPQATHEPPQTTMNQSAQVLAMKPPEPALQNIEQAPLPQNFRTVSTFEELIFLVEDKRDLQLKTQIKRHLRLVHFADGHIDMNLVENAPRDFLAVFGKKLEEWTGKRWMLSISAEEGAPTLSEVDAQENEARMDDAKNDPAVSAIMNQFPGARIVDIRVREAEETLEPAPEESGDGLDEFFE